MIIPEFFSENIDSAHVFGVFFYSDFQFDGCCRIQMKIIKTMIFIIRNIVDIAAFVVYGKFFQESELCAIDLPITRRINSPFSSEVSRRTVGGNFYAVDPYGNIAWPIFAVIGRLGTALEREW